MLRNYVLKLLNVPSKHLDTSMPTDANDAIDSERIIVKYFNIYIDGSKNTSVYAISYKI